METLHFQLSQDFYAQRLNSICIIVLVSKLPRLKVHRVALGPKHSNLLRKCLVDGIDLDIIITVSQTLELGHECMGEASLSVISLCVYFCWWVIWRRRTLRPSIEMSLPMAIDFKYGF